MAHLLERHTLARAHAAMMMLLVGGGLLICAAGAVIYDIGLLIGAW
ncbi:MAG: hypothetical protein IT536_03075 [Hyphomicrobiales bacterium]|nr:hypothetical protein [Hyphomicrobiales bacterium]